MSVRCTLALAAVLLGVGAACNGLDPVPVEKRRPHPEYAVRGAEVAPDLAVWAGDAELGGAALAASERIATATGLLVVVTSDTRGAVPIFWSDREDFAANGWLGFTHDGAGGDWITVDVDAPADALEVIVLHEILHALGAAHVPSGAGVLAPEVWSADEPLAAADLEAICAVRECTAFAPEED